MGIRILPLYGYGGTYPDPEVAAQWRADLVARYGPDGTFWAARDFADYGGCT